MSDGMILFPVKQWVDSRLPVDGFLRWLYKPVFGCVICMSSVWGTIGYLAIGGVVTNLYWLNTLFIVNPQWIVTIVCVAFMNIVLYSLLERIER